MRRITPGIVLIVGSVLMMAWCAVGPPSSGRHGREARTAGAADRARGSAGTGSAGGTGGAPALPPPGRDTGARSVAFAVLSARDLPPGFRPAGDPRAFQGLAPADPDCQRLLALADGLGLEGPGQAHTAFYRTRPAATITERVVPLSGHRAAVRITQARVAAAGCPVFEAGLGSRRMRLFRMIRPVAGLGQDAFAVRYTGLAPRLRRVRLDVFMAVVNGHLLIVNHPAVTGRRKRADLASIVEARAVRKLLAASGGP